MEWFILSTTKIKLNERFFIGKPYMINVSEKKHAVMLLHCYRTTRNLQ